MLKCMCLDVYFFLIIMILRLTNQTAMDIYIYTVYIYIPVHTHIYIYIYIYKQVNALLWFHHVSQPMRAFGVDCSTHGPLTIYYFTDLSLLPLRNVNAIMLHVSEVPRSGAVSAHAICVPHPGSTEPCSGPSLPTEPGTAKWTAPECGTERSHKSNEPGFGVKHARERLRLPSVSTLLFSRIPHTRVSTRPHSPIKCCPVPHSVALGPAGPAIVQVCTRKVHIMLWLRLWTLSITCFSIKHYKGILL